MAPILVTGASGFVGAHVVARLAAAGREVLAVTSPRAPEGSRARGVETVALDVREAGRLERLIAERGTTEVLYLAAAGVRGAASWDDLMAVNVLAPLAVARALAPVARHRL